MVSVVIADTPGKTGTPTIEDVDEDSVKLSWTPPKSDGGDKVKGYVIEAKEKGSNKWKPLNAKSPCKDTNFTGASSSMLAWRGGRVQWRASIFKIVTVTTAAIISILLYNT